MRTTPASLSCTVLALTTGNDIPASGTRLPRDAAAGALSVICNCASASWTVDAVVQTCRLFWPSSEICSGRLRRSTMVSDCAPAVGRGVKIVAFVDVEPVLLDDVDDPRLHGRHRHRRAVDGQRDRLVGGNSKAAGKGECEQ